MHAADASDLAASPQGVKGHDANRASASCIDSKVGKMNRDFDMVGFAVASEVLVL
jgi:hypothetical protein